MKRGYIKCTHLTLPYITYLSKTVNERNPNGCKSDYRPVGEYPGRFIMCSATTTYAAVQSVSYKPFRSPEWVWYCGFISTGPAVIQRLSYTQCDNDRSAQTVALTLHSRPSLKELYLSYCVCTIRSLIENL